MLTKQQYQKNRNNGLPGQGVVARQTVITDNLSSTPNRKAKRAKYHNGHFTNGKKLPKTKEVQEAIRQRILRKEKGEQERVAKKKKEQQ